MFIFSIRLSFHHSTNRLEYNAHVPPQAAEKKIFSSIGMLEIPEAS